METVPDLPHSIDTNALEQLRVDKLLDQLLRRPWFALQQGSSGPRGKIGRLQHTEHTKDFSLLGATILVAQRKLARTK